MAGENALLMSHKGVITLDWTATADVAKGDVVLLSYDGGKDTIPVFTLAAAKMGEVVPVVKEAALVRVDSPINAALPAGRHLRLDAGNIKVATQQSLRNNINTIGMVHHNKPARAAHLYIVWRAL